VTRKRKIDHFMSLRSAQRLKFSFARLKKSGQILLVCQDYYVKNSFHHDGPLGIYILVLETRARAASKPAMVIVK